MNHTAVLNGQMSFWEEEQGEITKLTAHEKRLFDFFCKGGQWSNRQIMAQTPDRDPRSTIRYLRNKGVAIADKWVKTPNSRFKLYFLKQ
ncbi:MAG: hypothetical protein LCH67_06225 [Bacteroidetes bacterium]|nr:hypothetical protein [Bacteroidota bacterium]